MTPVKSGSTALRIALLPLDERPVNITLPRQIAAIAGSPSRLELLSAIRAPTLIIHGAADPLVPVAAAHDLHRRIPGAALEIIDGMGHDLPPAILPRVTDRIIAHLRAAGRP